MDNEIKLTAAAKEELIRKLDDLCMDMSDVVCNSCTCPAYLKHPDGTKNDDCFAFRWRTDAQLLDAYNKMLEYEYDKVRTKAEELAKNAPKLTAEAFSVAVNAVLGTADNHSPTKTGQPKPELEQVSTIRQAILEAAIQCITGHRVGEYGKPEDSFGKIAQLWRAYNGHEYTAHDVAMMLALLKVARISTGHGGKDSYVDLAGYAACAGEINAKAGDDA